MYHTLISQTGKCGFPGKPKNGTVDLQLDPRLLNEKHPEVSFLTATYSCDENHVLVPSNGRQCVGRRWDGEVPQCRKLPME